MAIIVFLLGVCQETSVFACERLQNYTFSWIYNLSDSVKAGFKLNLKDDTISLIHFYSEIKIFEYTQPISTSEQLQLDNILSGNSEIHEKNIIPDNWLFEISLNNNIIEENNRYYNKSLILKTAILELLPVYPVFDVEIWNNECVYDKIGQIKSKKDFCYNEIKEWERIVLDFSYKKLPEFKTAFSVVATHNMVKYTNRHGDKINYINESEADLISTYLYRVNCNSYLYENALNSKFISVKITVDNKCIATIYNYYSSILKNRYADLIQTIISYSSMPVIVN